VSRDRPASDRGGQRRHVREQRQVVMNPAEATSGVLSQAQCLG
jgi:hypothetical protein